MKYLSLLLSGALLSLGIMSFKVERIERKKVKKFKVEKVLPFPAKDVWAVIGDDYGKIAQSHPKIIKSEYLGGTLKGEKGAERICYFNEEGTQFLKEKISEFDPENFTLINTVYQAGKFPVDPKRTFAIYKVEPIDSVSSRLSFDMTFRTTPKWMGG